MDESKFLIYLRENYDEKTMLINEEFILFNNGFYITLKIGSSNIMCYKFSREKTNENILYKRMSLDYSSFMLSRFRQNITDICNIAIKCLINDDNIEYYNVYNSETYKLVNQKNEPIIYIRLSSYEYIYKTLYSLTDKLLNIDDSLFLKNKGRFSKEVNNYFYQISTKDNIWLDESSSQKLDYNNMEATIKDFYCSRPSINDVLSIYVLNNLDRYNSFMSELYRFVSDGIMLYKISPTNPQLSIDMIGNVLINWMKEKLIK